MILGSRQELDQRERERRKASRMSQDELSSGARYTGNPPVSNAVLYVDKLPDHPTPGIEHRQIVRIEGDPSKEITDEKLILLDRRYRGLHI